MFYLILLFWVGLQLNAPVWYWVLLGALALLASVQFGWKLYKKGLEKGKK